MRTKSLKTYDTDKHGLNEKQGLWTKASALALGDSSMIYVSTIQAIKHTGRKCSRNFLAVI